MKQLILLVVTAIVMIGCSMTTPILGDDDGTGTDGDTSGVTDTTGSGDTTGVVDSTDDGGIGIDTSDGSGDQGIVIVSERTETIVFDSTGDGIDYLVGIDTVSLDDIRAEIEKENMSLSLFAVTNIAVNGVDEFNSLAIDLSEIPMVLTVSSYIPDSTEEIALVTPDSTNLYPVVTVGRLQSGIKINDGLYSKAGALSSFEDKVKDVTQKDVIIKIEVKFYEKVNIPDGYKLQFTIEGTSKKKV
jgi:hypothetical protein